jgi:hypothetical protein
MNWKRISVALAVGIPAVPFARAQQTAAAVAEVPGLSAAARAAAASIDSERIRAHVRFLSLDLPGGLAPGPAIPVREP